MTAVKAEPGYHDDKDAVLKRLRRIEGQVRGLQRMVEEDTYCIDVLTQVSAATKALQRVAVKPPGRSPAPLRQRRRQVRRRGSRRRLVGEATAPSSACCGADVLDQLRFHVPGMTCAHCVAAIDAELDALAGVEEVAIDLDTKEVVVTGLDLDRRAIWAAVDDAGYEAVE